MITLYALGSVIGVSLLSLLGILFFLVDERFIRSILLYVVSFSTGALLGDVFIHILPDMAEDADFFSTGLLIVLLGILFSFTVEKFVHWRHCHMLPEEDHGHHHAVGIMSLTGESLHNFIDGLVIAAGFLTSIPIGIATTLAVVFHEIPHEIGNFAVLLHSGFPKKKALLLNLLSASTGILGAALVLWLSRSLGSLTLYLLPFAAGNLLYIAGSDLIPELHKHTKIHQGFWQLIAMIVGMGFMYLIIIFE
ncbi:ZIP family metal transporter [Candidatus Peregrinibacteria bacterium]|nr:ZIP family metal transporter [Candidatus Peregrinibacteria bacterium]